jgi:hypothetical protein
MSGTISGGLSGRNIDMTITWDQGPIGRYTGQVDDDRYLRGDSVDQKTPSSRATYKSTFPIGCADAPAAPPVQQQGPQQTPKKTATVFGEDVDVYNIAHGDDPDENGVAGVKIGMLRVGQQVELPGPCQPKDWCKVNSSAITGGTGFVWGHLQF